MENSFKPQVEQAKADIRSIVNEMKTAEVSIIQSSKNIRESFNGAFKISTPDGLNQLMKDLDTTMTSLNESLNKQTSNTNKLSGAKRTLKNLSSEEVVNQRALAKNADLQATATSKLVGAYERLNAKRKIAKNNLRNLISSEKASTNEIKKARAEFNKYTKQLNLANKATSNFTKNSLGGMVRGFKNLLGAFGLIGGVTLIASLTKDVFKLVKEIESLNFALKTVTSSQEEFVRVQLFLEDISQRYGQSLITTTERYTKFLAAAKQSNLSLAKTEQIFESVTKAAGVLGLKTDELTGVYLALEQMLSKGKVTTEELRRQLGERLPGAFGIMAKAIGVNVSQLDKMLRKGEILSADALPKFAKAIEEAYGIENIKNVDTLVAAQNRLTNSWLLFVKSIEGSDGKISTVFKNVLGFVNKAITALTEFNKTFSDKMQEGNFAGTKVALEAITDESEKMNASVKEAADNLIPRYSKILEDWRKKLGEVNAEQSKSVATNVINTITGKFAENEATIKRAGTQIGKYTKALQILKQVSETGVLPTDEPDSKKEPEKGNGKKKKVKSKKGSLGFLEERIALYEMERKKLATNTDAYRGYTLAIEQLKETLSGLEGDFEIGTLTGGKVDIDSVGSGGNSEIELFKETQKAKVKALEDFKKQYDDINDEIKEGEEEKSRNEAQAAQARIKLNKDVFESVTKTFSGIFDIDISKFDFIFDSIENGFGTLEESIQQWGALTQEVVGATLDATLNKYEVELQEAQRSRDLILENDLSSEKQKRLAREKFDKEERRIKTERAKQERTNNLIKIAVDTAIGITAALSAGPAGIALAAVTAAIGIAQAAIVASQPLPKFAEGHLAGTHSGKALINDAKRRNYQEVVERGNGQVEVHKGRNKVIDMKRGDKVHKSMDSFLTHHNIEKDIMNMSVQAHNEQLMLADRGDMLSGKIDKMNNTFEEAVDRMEALGKRPIHNHNHLTIEKEFEY